MLRGHVPGREVRVTLGEGDQACVQVLQSGMNPTTRHLGRTRLFSIKWLREQTQHGRVAIEK
eukprot:2978821-Alexandrium_andersonii.AAC.1